VSALSPLVFFLYINQQSLSIRKITTLKNLPQIKPYDEAACQDDEN
jgi:hypothetical protein